MQRRGNSEKFLPECRRPIATAAWIAGESMPSGLGYIHCRKIFRIARFAMRSPKRNKAPRPLFSKSGCRRSRLFENTSGSEKAPPSTGGAFLPADSEPSPLSRPRKFFPDRDCFSPTSSIPVICRNRPSFYNSIHRRYTAARCRHLSARHPHCTSFQRPETGFGHIRTRNSRWRSLFRR